MSRTMKIDKDVAQRLAALKKKFKHGSYSDLLESFCDFFEITRLDPMDLHTSKKPASVVITERTNRIISFIKKGEDKYLKEILNLVEKIYINSNKNFEYLEPSPSSKPILGSTKNDIKGDKNPIEIEDLVKEKTNLLQIENNKLRSENEDLSYKINHQKKMVHEFLSKITPGKFGPYQIKKEEFIHYKEEIEKL